MTIKADEKFLDTFPLSCYLIQGEQNVDTVSLIVDRFYNDIDLSTCTFVLRAVNCNSEVVEQVLTQAVQTDTITLTWQITAYFTAIAGTLNLELRAITGDSSDPEETDLVLKYVLSPILIRDSVTGTSGLPTPDTTEQALNQIALALAEAISDLEDAADALDISEVLSELTNVQTELSTLTTRVTTLESRLCAVTQTAYDALESPDDDTLYIIVEEEAVSE